MKKLLATILFVSYFIASSGATVHVHYCMGKAVEIGLSKKGSDEKCPGCGMKDKKGCCNDKETTIKISDNYQHAVNSVQLFVPIIYIFNCQYLIEPVKITEPPILFTSNFQRQKTPSLLKLNCTFLI